MEIPNEAGGVIPVEVFAAKDPAGVLPRVMLTVPCRCGLKQADTLRVNGLSMVAILNRSILPIDFPNLTEQSRSNLAELARSGQRLAVAEFTARGLFDAYFLNVDVV